jgi:hypothetical protein
MVFRENAIGSSISENRSTCERLFYFLSICQMLCFGAVSAWRRWKLCHFVAFRAIDRHLVYFFT